MIKKKKIFILFLILLLGLCLRLYNLGGPSLWLDEAYTGYRVQLPFEEMMDIVDERPTPPLHYIVLFYFAKITGYSEFWLRFPSFVFSLLTIFAMYLLGKELYGQKTGLLAAFLISFSPYAINYGREARTYAMLWFFGTMSYVHFLRFCKNKDIKQLIIMTVYNILVMYSHYMGALFIIIENIIFVSILFKSYYWKGLKAWIIANCLVFLGFLYWINRSLFLAIEHKNYAWIPPIDNYPLLIGKTLVYVLGFTLGGYFLLSVLIFFMLLLPAFFRISKNKRIKLDLHKNDYYVLLMIILPVIIMIIPNLFSYPIYSQYTIRYVGMIHIPFLLLLAKSILKFPKKFRILTLVIFFTFMFSIHLTPYYFQNKKLVTQDWRPLFDDLCPKISDETFLLTSNNTLGPSFYYGDCFNGRIQKLYLVDPKEFPETIVFAALTWDLKQFAPEHYAVQETHIDGTVGYTMYKKITIK